MIYKVFLIDADNGISLVEATFRELKKIHDDILSGFFNAINTTIDVIQESMSKGRRVNEMDRVLQSEDSIIFIYYHPLSRVLFCAISDADDDTEKIEDVIHRISNRFWKKHQSDLKNFRATTDKSRFQTLIADIENLTMGGRIAEVFPKLLIARGVLEKVLSMGMIDEFALKVALQCSGANSPLKISRILNKKQSEITPILQKLEELEIIKI